MILPTNTSKGDWDQMSTDRKTRTMNLSDTTSMKGTTTSSGLHKKRQLISYWRWPNWAATYLLMNVLRCRKTENDKESQRLLLSLIPPTDRSLQSPDQSTWNWSLSSILQLHKYWNVTLSPYLSSEGFAVLLQLHSSVTYLTTYSDFLPICIRSLPLPLVRHLWIQRHSTLL